MNNTKSKALIKLIISICLFASYATSEEFLVDTNIVSGISSYYNQGYSQAAFNGSKYLVVWSENQKLHGTLVDRYGKAFTPLRFNFIDNAHNRTLCIASDGTDFLVISKGWTPTTASIYSMVITNNGTIQAPQDIGISKNMNFWPSSMVFNGDNYFLVGEYSAGESAMVYGFHISPSGSVIDSIKIQTAYVRQSTVAYNGQDYFIVWEQRKSAGSYNENEIYRARVSKTGVIIDPPALFVPQTYRHISDIKLAWSGENYCLAWETSIDSLFYSKVSSTGHLENPEGVPLPGDRIRLLDLKFNGKKYVISWSGMGLGYCADIPLSGNSLEDVTTVDSIRIIANHCSDSLSDYFVYLKDDNLVGKHVTTEPGFETNAVFLQESVNYHSSPHAVVWGNTFLTVWEDQQGETGTDISGSLIDEQGRLLTPQGIILSNDAGDQKKPRCAAGVSSSLVVWDNVYSKGIHGAVLSRDGTLLKSDFEISPTGREPDLAFDGTNFFVVWADSAIVGKRIDQSGTVIDTDKIVLADDKVYTFPRVCFGKDNYMVSFIHAKYNGG